MNKEKIIQVVRVINIVAVVCFAPIGLFSLMFALSRITNFDFNDQIVIIGVGYLIAFIAGILSFKKSSWLAVSIYGWLLLGWGQTMYIEADQQEDERKQLCSVLRHNPDCTEDEKGGMRCRSGIYPTVCQGVRK